MRELPKGWVWTTIGEVAQAEYGKGLAASDRDGSGPVPVVGSAGVSGFHTRALVDEAVIVIGRKGNAGSVLAMNGPSWPIDTTYFLRAPSGIDRALLAYQLDHLNLRSLDSSTAVPSLRRQDLEAQRIAIAPLAEQERIVAAIEEHLSRLDASGGTLGAAESRLRSLRQKSAEGLVPEAPHITLGELALERGYGTSTKCSYEGLGPGVLRIPNISKGRVSLHDLKYAIDGGGVTAGSMLDAGDVLFVRTNGSRSLIGRTAVAGEAAGFAFASYLIRYRFREEVLPEYVSTVLTAPSMRRTLEELAATTAGQYNLSISKLDSVSIPVPTMQVQRDVVERQQETHGAFARISDAISLTARRSAALRRSILAAAFSGQLVPQDPSDEPASVLLERIRAERAQAPTAKRRVAS